MVALMVAQLTCCLVHCGELKLVCIAIGSGGPVFTRLKIGYFRKQLVDLKAVNRRSAVKVE